VKHGLYLIRYGKYPYWLRLGQYISENKLNQCYDSGNNSDNYADGNGGNIMSDFDTMNEIWRLVISIAVFFLALDNLSK